MTNSPSVHSTTSKGFRILKWLAAIFVVALLALVLRICWDIATAPPVKINPLAPDEELIAYFQEHRADIEELVHRYRTYEPPPPSQDHHLWMKQGDTPERFKRAGLWTLDYAGSVWFPNPYSVETAKQVDATPGFERSIKHGTIQIRIDDRRFYLNGIWKNIIFIPIVPRIENGVLLGPVDTRGRHFGNLRVVPSLNGEPPDCQRDECVLRQIEPQWFIQMCRIF